MMYCFTRRTTICAILVLALCFLGAIPAQAATERILLVGDSWTWFMWLNRSFRDALSDAGLGEYEEAGLYTCIPGSKATQWLNPDWLDVVTRELEAKPSVDIIHLSLGGNDFLREWRKDMPEQKRDALFSRIVHDIEVVVRHCLSVRPGIRVAIVNYDYINQPKGNATLQELNEAGMILARRKMELAQRIDRCEYIQNYGLMQYHFGVSPDLKPREVPYPGQAPAFEPFPGGHRDYGNPPEAMLDRIHLSPKGYRRLAEHCVDVLYAKWLAHPVETAETIKAAAR